MEKYIPVDRVLVCSALPFTKEYIFVRANDGSALKCYSILKRAHRI
jgi:hypothetical protein